MAELKTKKNNSDIDQYIQRLDPDRKADCTVLREMMESATKLSGSMWGTDIVGFGSYHYIYESGREGDWFFTGFSSRKQAISLYMMADFEGRDELMMKLGKHKIGKSCLSIKKLDDIHIPTLKTLIRKSIKSLQAKYP
jgi:Domain of unknown function (DU1801)